MCLADVQNVLLTSGFHLRQYLLQLQAFPVNRLFKQEVCPDRQPIAVAVPPFLQNRMLVVWVFNAHGKQQ
jgi:hypothetical protein